jgi:hypothetical protein
MRMTTRRIRIGPRGEYAVRVDARDFAFLTQWRWGFVRLQWRYGAGVYARREARRNGRRLRIYMHRVILRERMRLAPPTPRHQCDHRDIDSLNNTRRNLRWATPSVQITNRRPRITKAQIVAFRVAETGCARRQRKSQGKEGH